MKLSITQKRKLKDVIIIVTSGVCVAMIYPVFADGWGRPIAFVNAFFIGLVGGIMVAVTELEVFDPQRKRRSFLFSLILKTLIYFLFFALLVPLIMAFNESIYYNRGFREHIRSEQFQRFLFHEDYSIILIYSFVFIAIIIFTRQMSRKLGQGVLLSYLLGRFHQPKEVERIFMFLDIRSSTTIAEKLGEINFHNFIRDFFYDITSSILLAKGNIYRYVGDQVVVTWKMRNGLDNANCINTYFYIKNRLKSLREKYILQYGFAPRFSASFHSGQVIVGEIGDIKSQIVYHGELLYQLAIIEKLHGKFELEENILITAPLIQQISLPALYKIVLVTETDYTQNISFDIYTLREVDA